MNCRSGVTRQLRKTPTSSMTILKKCQNAKYLQIQQVSSIEESCQPCETGNLTSAEGYSQWNPCGMGLYLKLEFQQVIFTDECRATLDGPGKRSKIWVPEGALPPGLAGIIGDELVGPFGVPVGVKLTAVAYVDFLGQNMGAWCKKTPLSFRKKTVFIHDNSPSNASKHADFLATVGFKCKILMTSMACFLSRYKPN